MSYMAFNKMRGCQGVQYSTKRNRKLQLTYILTTVPASTWVMFVLFQQQMFYAILTHFNTTFSSTSYWKAYISKNSLFPLESPDRLSIPVAVTRLRH